MSGKLKKALLLLLAGALLFYAVGRLACALAPGYAWLAPLRALAAQRL